MDSAYIMGPWEYRNTLADLESKNPLPKILNTTFFGAQVNRSNTNTQVVPTEGMQYWEEGIIMDYVMDKGLIRII